MKRFTIDCSQCETITRTQSKAIQVPDDFDEAELEGSNFVDDESCFPVELTGLICDVWEWKPDDPQCVEQIDAIEVTADAPDFELVREGKMIRVKRLVPPLVEKGTSEFLQYLTVGLSKDLPPKESLSILAHACCVVIGISRTKIGRQPLDDTNRADFEQRLNELVEATTRREIEAVAQPRLIDNNQIC